MIISINAAWFMQSAFREELVRAPLDFQSNHDLNRLSERRGEEEVRLCKFAPKDQNPEQDRADSVLFVEGWIAGGEGLTSEVLSRLACHTIAEHPARRHDGEEHRCYDRNEELHDAQDERERPSRTVVFHDGNVKCWAACKTESDE